MSRMPSSNARAGTAGPVNPGARLYCERGLPRRSSTPRRYLGIHFAERDAEVYFFAELASWE
jgi:hypothetical protein